VDDGSKYESAVVAQRYASQIRLVQQPNLGAAAARYRGVELAQGELLAFLDADDLWIPDKLEHQMAALTGDSSLDMVFGQVEQFCSSDLSEENRFTDVGQVMTGLHVGAMLIRAEAFHRVGPFRTDVRVGEFVDWYGRAMEQGLRSLVLSDIVMRRRLHTDNLMRHTQNVAEEYMTILRDTLHRRRG
jgi:glycosyltransferase involved in cell wall biosynthesis